MQAGGTLWTKNKTSFLQICICTDIITRKNELGYIITVVIIYPRNMSRIFLTINGE